MVDLTEGMRKDFCVAIHVLLNKTGGRAFTIMDAIQILLQDQKQIRYADKERGIKTRNDMRAEDIGDFLLSMKKHSYIEFSHTKYPDKRDPTSKIPVSGISFWRINPLRITECKTTTWYKAKVRRDEYRKREKNIDKRMCQTLTFINGIFDDKPFTYDMVKNAINYLANTSLQKTDREKELTREVKNLHERGIGDLLPTWNALIRNGYLLPYDRRDTVRARQERGIIKEYVVNKKYVRRCYNVISS
jgi:hypothetical protein